MSQRANDASLPRTKKGCSPARWIAVAKIEAEKAGVCPIKMLAGYKRREFVEARWNAWRILSAAGCSYFSIGLASGFDHSTVMHGCCATMRARRCERYKAKYLQRKSRVSA